MLIDNCYIYWKEQCFFCLNRTNCQYKNKVQIYLENLDKVDDRGCYGNLEFKCDYFFLDKEKYKKSSIMESCTNG